MGQKAGEKWTVAAALQPTFLLPPRLLAVWRPEELVQNTYMGRFTGFVSSNRVFIGSRVFWALTLAASVLMLFFSVLLAVNFSVVNRISGLVPRFESWEKRKSRFAVFVRMYSKFRWRGAGLY
ncbi:MAG: hypothetical protein Q8O29_05015 [Polaromonas sp.]|uniref:hypothetical protein n=1 Tax=Polaromonas sp. TaxID=1869339 RepID=UPI0027322F33|nr:hypothetical protein [Polaromonas sp.]MDP2817631.1 hypothetical protein [Polaromonas sp.]